MSERGYEPAAMIEATCGLHGAHADVVAIHDGPLVTTFDLTPR